MAYHPRIESSEHATFVTTRTRNRALWFANNKPVETFILGLLAKVLDRYRAKIYAFALEGNHYHNAMEFPLQNRADFCRDFNSGIARGVARLTPNYQGGGLWGRRYSGEVIADDAGIEKEFFYIVLQPVKDGLVDRISDYPGYNCFHDAVCGIPRTFKLVNWAKYNSDKRFNSRIRIKDYQQVFTLRYERLPGYEDLTQHEYRVMMEKKLEEHRQVILEERRQKGKTECVGRDALLKVKPGRLPISRSEADMTTARPRVLGSSSERRRTVTRWYFRTFYEFKEASRRYLAGELDVEFPPGTYRPPIWLTARPRGPYSPI